MSAYDKVMQVKELLANNGSTMSFQFKGGLNFSSLAKLINESALKVKNLTGRKALVNIENTNSSSSGSINQRTDKIPCLAIDHLITLNSEKSITSMVKLTNYVLYDDLGVKSDTIADVKQCLFELGETDLAQVKHFADEIDSIQIELSELADKIKSIEASYKSYYENFLSLCDKKDELFELFLDYYEEYFLNTGDQNESCRMLLSKSNAKSSSKSKVNKATSSSTKDKSTKPKSNTDQDKHDDDENEMDEMEFRPKNAKSNIVRRKSSIYIYSVPTENRFSILSKTDSGTLIKHHYQ